MIFKNKDVDIFNNYVSVKGIGTIALWWPKFDKKVCVDHSIGESFYANSEEEVVNGILKIINKP